MSYERDTWNGCRHQPGSAAGHYESYFQRANHANRPLGFWVRYTIFNPADPGRDAIGELWAIWFDGEQNTITAVKREVPLSRCQFSNSELSVNIDGATLDAHSLRGDATLATHTIAWNLSYQGNERPLLLLPRGFYSRKLPKAKILVGTPNARYRGTINVDNVTHNIDGWLGSQNHNWGSQHTDHYAWGQVAGFDDEEDSFFECGSARLKFGPVWTPTMTVMVLRTEGQEYRLNGLARSVLARARFSERTLDWRFRSRLRDVEIEGRVQAPRSHFVGLTYFDPPGGSKTCLNSKIASCDLILRRAGHPPKHMTSTHRAAFEILTNDRDHGIPMAT